MSPAQFSAFIALIAQKADQLGLVGDARTVFINFIALRTIAQSFSDSLPAAWGVPPWPWPTSDL